MPALSLRRLAVAASLAVVVTGSLTANALPAYAEDTTGTVAGHLLDGTTALSDVPVVLQLPDNTADIANAVTDSTGAFSFADVPPGNYLVRYELPGGVRQYYPQSARYDVGAQPISVVAGEQTPVETTVLPHATVTGLVQTAGGTALQNATIMLDPTFYTETYPTVTTDAAGAYRIPYVVPGTYRVRVQDNTTGLVQYVPGRTSQSQGDELSFEVGQTATVNETQLPIGTLAGTVTPGTAKRVDVRAYAVNGSNIVSSATVNLADGSFSMPMFAGPVQLEFKSNDGRTTSYQWYHQQTKRTNAESVYVPAGGVASIEETIIGSTPTTGTISGMLTDETGAVVVGAAVTAINTSTNVSYPATTNEYGKYSVTVPVGVYQVRFQANGITQWAYGKYLDYAADAFSVTAGKTVTVSDTLRPPSVGGTGIAGRLTDGGQPVAEVGVTIWNEYYDWIDYVTTGADGSFALPYVWAGTYKVSFSLPGGVQQWSHQKLTFESADIIEVVDGQATILDEELAPHGQITGHLTRTDGTAVGGAYVVATSTDGQVMAQANTDTDGSYSFPFLPAGNYTVSFRPFGYEGPTQFAHGKSRVEDADVITVGVGATVTVDDEVLPFATVTGQLTGNGQPVPFAQVYLHDAVTDDVTYAFTDSDGRYSARLRPGRYKVSFVLENGLIQWAHQARTKADATVFTFAEGDNVLDEAMLPTATIRGQLTDSYGYPVTSGTVEISGGGEFFNAYLDWNGEWSATVVPGSYKVRFMTDTANQWAYGKTTAQAADTVTVAAGDTAVVDDALLPPGSMAITAADAATGAPISTFCAYADNGVTSYGCTTTGTVNLDGLSAGEYTVATYVEEEDSDYIMTQTKRVVVLSGQQTTVAAKLRKGATFSTTVTDAKSGAPVPGACVELVETDRPSYLGASRKVCANDQGVVTQNGITPDDYNLFVWITDGVHGRQWVGPTGGVGAQAKAKKVTLTSGKTTTVPAIKLDRAGSVSGIITDKATGAPIANAIAALSSYNDGHGGGGGAPGALVATDAQGRYTLTDLGPYDWTLFFRHRQYAAQWSGNVPNRLLADGVKVKVNTTTQYNVKLRKGTTLTGKVVASDGQPASARITVINAVTGDEMGSGDTAPDGTYTVPVFGRSSSSSRSMDRPTASGAPSTTTTRTTSVTPTRSRSPSPARRP
ncbi:carboxypeptidase regulatory-like domain-containing protein [Luedemannella flava]